MSPRRRRTQARFQITLRDNLELHLFAKTTTPTRVDNLNSIHSRTVLFDVNKDSQCQIRQFLQGGPPRMRTALLKRRRIIIARGYDDEAEKKAVMLKFPLTDAELGYLNSVLAQPDIEEEDAELILTIMRDHAKKVEKRLPDIIRSFPNLTKSVHGFCSGVEDKEFLAKAIETILETSPRLLEFQLFWFAAILEDHLMDTSRASALIDLLYNHNSATPISRAKILEIQDSRYGLTEIRASILSTGQSDWLGWSAAVGSRALKAGSRNHAIKYFGNCSQ
ncbi:hypothetical protein ABIA18_002649 [Sinorhizobium fredii]